MTIRKIEAKSLLRKQKRVDSWFVSCYGMNLYRGCTHNCVYCDGRTESYRVEGEFGNDLEVKINAIEVLGRELDPKRKRKPFKRSFMMMGGGVGDSYQPAEEEYQLTHEALDLVYRYHFPVHVLTKSTLVKRDVEILKKINEKSRAMVSFSLSSVDDDITALVEPGVPPPSERLAAIAYLQKEGLHCGVFLMPVIPFITDTDEMLEESVKKVADAGAEFIIFSGMTLKEGRQKDYFFKALEVRYPKLKEKYRGIYKGNRWGSPTEEYASQLNKRFHRIARKYRIPLRIPASLYHDVLTENDRVCVMLDQLDYLLKMEGRSSPYAYASYVISRLDKPLSFMKGNLQDLKGVGAVTERIILEILETGTSSYYERLLCG